MSKKKRGRQAYLLDLSCENCGHKFISERFKKYCTIRCQLEVNKRKAGFRYDKLRKALLRQQGKLIE